jgi:hypothetical protein
VSAFTQNDNDRKMLTKVPHQLTFHEPLAANAVLKVCSDSTSPTVALLFMLFGYDLHFDAVRNPLMMRCVAYGSAPPDDTDVLLSCSNSRDREA